MKEQILTLLQSVTPIQWVIVLLVVVLIVVAVIFREKTAVKAIIKEAIRYSAEYLNGKEGQEKMDAAVKYVQEHSNSLPFLARIFVERFVTKAKLVDMIEKIYQILKDSLKLEFPDELIDIKGNEDDKKKELM